MDDSCTRIMRFGWGLTAGWWRWGTLALATTLLAACASTGNAFDSAGLDRIVTGRTTLEQASSYLSARPVDVWQQGDTTLARWAYKGSLATDAVYFRQEVWLRFGPDGTFQSMENGINLPPHRHPRPAEEVGRTAPVPLQPAHPLLSSDTQLIPGTTYPVAAKP